jgi:hypothetical protein
MPLNQFLVCVAIRSKFMIHNPAAPACVHGIIFSRVKFARAGSGCIS